MLEKSSLKRPQNQEPQSIMAVEAPGLCSNTTPSVLGGLYCGRGCRLSICTFPYQFTTKLLRAMHVLASVSYCVCTRVHVHVCVEARS